MNCKRTVFHVLLLTLLLGQFTACSPQAGRGSSAKDADAPAQSPYPALISPVLVTTEYQYGPLALPPHARIDTIRESDEQLHYDMDYGVVRFEDEALQPFNQFLTDTLGRIVSHEMAYFREPGTELDAYSNYSMSLYPIQIFQNEAYLSLVYVADSYTTGGNHHNYHHYAFTYDRNGNRGVGLKDIFHLESSEDSTAFVALAERNRDHGCSGWGSAEYVEFAIEEKGLRLYPNLSWACEGTESFLPVDTLVKYALPGFRLD